MIYRTMQPDFCFEDQRGSVVQLVHGGYQQVNVLTTKAGVTRGGHCHKRCTEAFYVISGEVKVTFKRGGLREERIFKNGEFFKILPDTVHTIAFLKDSVLLALYDEPVETAAGKDIFLEGGE